MCFLSSKLILTWLICCSIQTGLVDELRSDKAAAEQQLMKFTERFNAIQKDFTSLLQEKAEEIRAEFEAKRQVPLTILEYKA